ncbi:MAG: GGDEF domain-containing protein [Campylobacterota bacterium]|nr:GGDEF domain-containing protein [Campylobacterota bacterium]
MLREESIHQKITEEAKKQIDEMDIVLPSRYSMLFTDIAKEMEVDLGAETFISNESIEDKVIEHAAQLGDSATKAVDAMENNDSASLQEVIDETLKLREEIASLRSAVYEDALTGAFNRKWMQDHFMTSEGTHFRSKGVFVIVDMNDFKYINDNFGHVSGDKVLSFITLQLQRSGGKVIRYGGDEFCIMFESDATVESVGQKMHIIRETVIKKQLKVEDKRFKTSFSYGISSFETEEEVTSVIEAADSKMYEDKIQIKARLSKMKG